MNIQIGDNALITTNDWFYAPDGKKYKAVFGQVKGIEKTEDVLGIKTNAKSTNWYLLIGNMIVAGCQIHYAVKTDSVNLGQVPDYHYNSEKVLKHTRPTEIYNANQ